MMPVLLHVFLGFYQAQPAAMAIGRAMPEAFATAVSRPPALPPHAWHDDYTKAMDQARAQRKMLLIVFQAAANAAMPAFEGKSLADDEVHRLLEPFVLCRLPLDATIEKDGQSLRIVDHGAFAEMHGRQGVAIVDLAHDGEGINGHVVSTFPFSAGRYYQADSMKVILTLPPGTLTQRTMVYAVRMHPERPASTSGEVSPVLETAAQSHSTLQAKIQVQGHHAWESRFHRISAQLPGGMLPQEVVAESWPNEDLVEACVDCVASWRQSPGHWSAVRDRHPLFGYDIKRGRNGIWYATGIFGRR